MTVVLVDSLLGYSREAQQIKNSFMKMVVPDDRPKEISKADVHNLKSPSKEFKRRCVELSTTLSKKDTTVE